MTCLASPDRIRRGYLFVGESAERGVAVDRALWLAAEADLDEHREHHPADDSANGGADQRRQRSPPVVRLQHRCPPPAGPGRNGR
jgi:hypothetical protein